MGRIRDSFARLRVLGNHLLRIERAHGRLRTTREIVEMRDETHKRMLEEERREDKSATLRYRAQLEVLKWVLQE